MSDTSDFFVAKDFLDAMQGETFAEPLLRLIEGEIMATDTTNGRVTVTIGGGVTQIPGVRYFVFYSPSVGDIVWILANGNDYLVLGNLSDGVIES